jgi:hypothetical protein
MFAGPAMMIPYDDFGSFRLGRFLPDDEVAPLEDWEFQGHLWIGEALGFSEWLRLESDSGVLRSLAIDFLDFPAPAAVAVLRALQLPILAGMSLQDLDGLFGSRVAEHRFVADRVTCDYFTPEPYRYRISCTVLNPGGLSYVVVMVPPIGDEDDEG